MNDPPNSSSVVTIVAPATEWKTPAGIIGIYSQTLLLAGLLIACYLKNENAIMMVLGAIVASATTVTNYYMGSSKSSQAKDNTIAAQLPNPPPPTGTTTTVTEPPAPVVPK